MGPFRFALAVSGAAICAAGLMTPAAAMADVPKAQIKGDAPDELKAAMERAVGTSKTPAASRLEARARARAAAEDVILVLRSEGYYAYDVVPDVGEGEPAQAIVTVTPGPQFHIFAPKVTWIGAPPAPAARTAGEASVDLKDGQPGRAADIVGAEGRIVSVVEKRGYADAAIEPREVIVDHADMTVRPEVRINAGDLVKLDGIDLRTKGRTNPAWVRGLAPWASGAVYRPEDVAELERRLLDVGVYDSVTVALAPKDSTTADGLRPVLVSLSDRPKGTVELGAGYSTSEGVGVDGRWLRYNQLGRADTLTSLFRLAQIEQRLGTELSLPEWRKPQRTLKIGAGVFRLNTDAYDQVGANVHVDLTKRYAKTSYRTIGLAVDITRTDEMLPAPQTRDLITLTGLGALTWDHSNDPLDPKTGWRFDGRIEPTAATGDATLFYLRALAQVTGYLPFGGQANTVVAGRVKFGTVTGVSLADVPAATRLYAGGGGSVRGYDYQGVGPRLSNGTPQGGISLVEASAEVRQKFTQRWGGVAFIDVGAVGEQSTPSFSRISTGVGVGVRYNLGFGPIRADVAIPLNRRAGDPAYQIYLSIGQSF